MKLSKFIPDWLINLNLSYSKLIIIIIFIASILRLWNLDNTPPHLRNDEAALGYNAYSILKTGKDEHGELLPLIFQSFGDWKMGLYIYLTIPFISMLGLNELSTRLPSAIFGVVTVWLTFKIVLQLFASRKLALMATLVFAISPLLIIFSRGAWEVNVSLTLTMSAIYFFLKAVSGKSQFLLSSSFFFGLTLITSHTAKLSTPIILATLSLAYFKQVKAVPLKLILLSVLIGIILTIPVGLSFAQGKFTRITTLSIFSYYENPPSIFQAITSRWFNLYSASTLFIKGDTNPQHGAPNSGPFLILDSIFLIAGIIKLIRNGTYQQNIFIWAGLLLLSLPSALTIEKVNFERVLPMFVPLLILVSLGINSLWENVEKRYKKSAKLIFITFICFYLLNYVYFLDQYFIHGSKKNDAWQYGYKQIVEKVTPLQNKYGQIIVQQSLEHPYIFFLFYQKYDPKKYQKIVKDVFVPNQEGKDMGQVVKIGNIKFEDIDWLNKIPLKDTVYVMPVYKLEQQTKFYSSYEKLDEVRDLNGFPLFKIIKI